MMSIVVAHVLLVAVVIETAVTIHSTNIKHQLYAKILYAGENCDNILKPSWPQKVSYLVRDTHINQIATQTKIEISTVMQTWQRSLVTHHHLQPLRHTIIILFLQARNPRSRGLNI